MSSRLKPKLVFFQWDHRGVPEFTQLHMQLHTKCLAEQFDVTVVHGGGDYGQVCDRFEPDLVLFEAGVNYHGSRKPTISNTSACASIPKVGLHNGDPWCEARAGFLSDMDHWGVETFFSISTTMAEHTPDIADRLFVWPNFIDGDLYRDYGEFKNIPVLLTGNAIPLYPWRMRLRDILPLHYPSLVCPHLGYRKQSTAGMMYGEGYARLINASSCVPACGTVAKELLRKHLEIPASRSCLITERSPVLEAAGFVDMKNCIFAGPDDVLDKMDHVFQQPDELRRITDAGYSLVHSQHTLRQRNQIRQWFELYRSQPSTHKVVQPGPFEPLASVSIASGVKSAHISGNGLHIEALHQGDAKLRAGALDEAESLYRRCLNYISWMPEPRVRLSICMLRRGYEKAARELLRQPVEYTLNKYAAVDPDPVEWAYLIVSLVCGGDLAGAAAYASKYPHLRHPELDRARWALSVLRRERMELPTGDLDVQHRRSVHSLPARTLEEWLGDLCMMLSACGQTALAASVRAAFASQAASRPHLRAQSNLRPPLPVPAANRATKHRPGSDLLPYERVSFRGVVLKLSPLIRAVAIPIVRWLNHLEDRIGHFLPYRYSTVRNDEFAMTLRSLVAQNEIRTAMVIGASSGVIDTEALLSFRASWRRLVLYFINAPTSGFRRLARRCAKDPLIRCRTLEGGDFRADVSTGSMKLADQSGGLDLLVIDASRTPNDLRMDDVAGPRFVVLDHINQPRNFEVHQSLLRKPEYELIIQNLSLRDGYSVFRRAASESVRA